MCGICGIVKFGGDHVNPVALSRMNETMVSRGPDDEGSFIDKNIGLAMRRLSIIDVATGHQPLFNEDKSLVIVMNGEIYNYKELRKELICKGHRFSSHSDTEVILHLYEEEGLNSVNRLNGMFAFCLFDRTTQKIWLVRDRIGIKPLYYLQDSHSFVFASQLNSISSFLEKKVTLSKKSWLLFMALGYVPGSTAIFEEVKKLEPGTWLLIHDGVCSKKRYWELKNFETLRCREEEAVTKLKELLHDSIHLQQRSDVPVGTFLSGGLDSSAIVSLLATQVESPVRTYSVGFSGISSSELPYAKIVSETFKTIHREVMISERDVSRHLREIVNFMDEPIADSALIPSYLLSKLAVEDGVKVVLNGTGGDEVFCGYPWHGKTPGRLQKGLSYLPGSLAGALKHVIGVTDKERKLSLHSEQIEHVKNISGIHFTLFENILREKDSAAWIVSEVTRLFDYDRRCFGTDNVYYKKMYMDLQEYMVGDILALLDKTSMAVSLEGRVPLLDHRIVEYAYSLDSSLTVGNDERKKLFKTALKGIVPEVIRRRKDKMGFAGPVRHWLKGELKKEIVQDLLNEPVAEYSQWLNMDKVKYFLKDENYNDSYADTIFNLYVFNLWRKSH